MSAQKPTPLVAGNWKMNGLKAAQSELLGIIERVSNAKPQADVMLCPPATLLARFADVASDSAVAIGAQDCHPQPSGAHTGDISAEMLKDAGASAVIVGHSERRADHGESDRDVHDKALAAYGVGLIAIICVGETEAQRDAGQTLDIVGGQLRGSVPNAAAADNTVIAYEPVWAIGTGKVPSRGDVAEVHAMIRERLVERFGGAGRAMRILYGGSVKPSNAAALMTVENVDGALIGGASLKARDFDGILDAYR